MVKFYCIFLFLIILNVELCIGLRVNIVTMREYPFNALVYSSEMFETLKDGRLGCSGVIIRQDLILTAASCLYFIQETKVASRMSLEYYNISLLYKVIYDKMYGRPAPAFVNGKEYAKIPAYSLKVWLGSDQPFEPRVKKVREHPLYRRGIPYYDLAVLQLVNNLFLKPNTMPIKLATKKALYMFSVEGLLTGYGDTEENQGYFSRHLQSVRTIITSTKSCDQESDKDSTERNAMRKIYNNDRNIDKRRIFCVRAHKGDEGMCKGWHVGSALTVNEGEDRRLVGIVWTPQICSDNSTAIVTSLRDMSDWSFGDE